MATNDLEFACIATLNTKRRRFESQNGSQAYVASFSAARPLVFNADVYVTMQFTWLTRKCPAVFNIDLLKVNDKPIVSEYLDMVISHGFFPKITLPTRLSERSGKLIDDIHIANNFQSV